MSTLRRSKDRRTPDIQCPAAELANPIFSPNKSDIRCRVGGGLQPSKDSKCCTEYATCGIYASVRAVELTNSTKKQRDLAVPGPIADDPLRR